MKHLILFLFIAFSFALHCQSEKSINTVFSSPNNFHIELGGHGLLYSINYERILLNKPKLKTSFHTGISYYPRSSGIIDYWFPLILNQMISFDKHHIELGIGIVPTREARRTIEGIPIEWNWNKFISGRIGYRFQKPDGKFIYRAAITPFAETPAGFESFRILKDGIYLSGGLSIGYVID